MRVLSKIEGPAAELRAATKRYGDVVGLARVDLEVRPGEVTAILGPNGAGKTTAVKLMLGLLRPTSGEALLLGGSPRAAAARQRIGAMLQISSLPETLRVEELVQLFRTYYPEPMAVAEVLAAAGLEGLERRLYGRLSGGQKQRVVFALAICGRPEILFLDEPTVGLDVETRRSFWSTVRALVADGLTIVLTTHYLEEADALSDRIVVLHDGRIRADGTPHQIKARAAVRRIRCRTSITPARLSELDGVRAARYDKAMVEVLVSEAEPVVRYLLDRDPDLEALEVTGAGIEDAFLALTRNDPSGECATAPAGREEVA